MAGKSRRRKRKKSKSKQKYIPIVVLNNQIPIQRETNRLDLNKPQVEKYQRRIFRPTPRNFLYHQSNNPHRFQERFGLSLDHDVDGSNSGDTYLSESYNDQGCCGGGSNGGLSTTEALIFLAALAFAVAFLNQQITMFLGKERRKRRKRREIGHFQSSKFRHLIELCSFLLISTPGSGTLKAYQTQFFATTQRLLSSS